MGGLLILGVPLLLLLIWVVATYNRLVNLQNLLRNSWGNIDTELKRRYDLIPNLVEVVKAYAAHEREILQRVGEARRRALASIGSPASQAADENALIRELRRVYAVVERYPELKASEQFLGLQDELVNTEDRIQSARRFYNGNVKDLNNAVEMFPSSLLAGLFGVRGAEYFEIDDSRQRQAPGLRGS